MRGSKFKRNYFKIIEQLVQRCVNMKIIKSKNIAHKCKVTENLFIRWQ